MQLTSRTGAVLVVLLAGLAMTAVGCGKEKENVAQAKEGDKAHDHGGWWCDEHGVPEDICGQCNAKVAADFKKKGDWCAEHDRPDSQCFIHHPELKEKFADQYRKKYGKEPPPMEEESPKKEDTKEPKK